MNTFDWLRSSLYGVAGGLLRLMGFGIGDWEFWAVMSLMIGVQLLTYGEQKVARKD